MTIEKLMGERIKISPSGCWLWLAYTSKDGYGRLTHLGETLTAHRYTYRELVGPIPDRAHLHHQCRNRRCVNPEHLQPLSASVHIGLHSKCSPKQLSVRRKSQTHCIYDHELAGENVYVRGDGRRNCMTCKRINDKRFKQRKKLQRKY